MYGFMTVFGELENTFCVHLHEALIKRRVVVDLEMWISVDECLAETHMRVIV